MHDSRKEHRRQELVLDDTSSKCLTALVPASLAHQIRALKTHNSELLVLSERQLIKEMARQGLPPDSRDFTLRLRFWNEFERVQDAVGTQISVMNMAFVLGRAIAKEAFYLHYATHPLKLAWLLCPPQNYMLLLEESLTRVMYRIADYLEKTEITDENMLKTARLADELHRRYVALRYKDGMRVPRGTMLFPTEEPVNPGLVLEGVTPEQKLEALHAAEAEAKVTDE